MSDTFYAQQRFVFLHCISISWNNWFCSSFFGRRSDGSDGNTLRARNQEVDNYIATYGIRDIMVQEYINTKFEVGVLYERNPLFNDGHVISIVERSNYDAIVRNGQSGTENLLNKYKCRPDLMTDKINRIFNTISKQLPDFYVGRYDVKYVSDDDFLAGNFYILEVNGIMGFDMSRFCCGDTLITNSINSIYNNLRWIFTRIWYGLLNNITLNAYHPLELPNVCYNIFINAVNCKDLEKIFSN